MREFLRTFTRDLATIAGMVAFAVLTIGVLLIHLTNEFRIASIGYDLASVTSEHRQLIEDHRRLKVEAAMLGRTDDIAARASEHMKLEQALPEDIRVVVDEDPAIASLMR